MMNTASLRRNESSAVAGTVALLPVETVEQLVGLVNRVERCVNSAGENLGHMEEELLRGGRSAFRQRAGTSVSDATTGFRLALAPQFSPPASKPGESER